MNYMLRFSLGALLAAALAAQTPALRKGVSVQMAVSTHAAAMPDADLADSVVVAVTYRGVVYLDIATVTPEQLSEKVKPQLAGQPGKRVYLKGDARTPYATVSSALDALRSAGVSAPILLTSQPQPTVGSYMLPMGLEVLLAPPPDAESVTLKAGDASDAELKQRARRDTPIVLQADGTMPFGDIVHAADVCLAQGAKVFLAPAR